jgi:hypothetical protein
MRIKSILTERQPSGSRCSCDGRHLQTSYQGTDVTSLVHQQRTSQDATAISGEKGGNRIRQSIEPNSWYFPKRRLPKSESQKKMAMSVGSEYPIWQRSLHSSPSRIMTCTWRREAVSNVLIQILKTCKTNGKIRKSIKSSK